MSALLANLKSVALKFWWQHLLYQKSRDTCDQIAMTDSGDTAKDVTVPNFTLQLPLEKYVFYITSNKGFIFNIN